MADASVRPAGAADAAALAALQVRVWLASYAGAWPVSVLEEFARSEPQFAAQWAVATTQPPTSEHRVLVACAGATVVGGAAFGPASDDDLDAATAGELFLLVVDPDFRTAGHASRLVAATVDHLRGDGFTEASAWVDAADDGLRGLLVSSGWDTDGSHRSLDFAGDGALVVRQVRLHTVLREGN